MLCVVSICKAHLWEVGWKEEESEERGEGGGSACLHLPFWLRVLPKAYPFSYNHHQNNNKRSQFIPDLLHLLGPKPHTSVLLPGPYPPPTPGGGLSQVLTHRFTRLLETESLSPAGSAGYRCCSPLQHPAELQERGDGYPRRQATTARSS